MRHSNQFTVKFSLHPDGAETKSKPIFGAFIKSDAQVYFSHRGTRCPAGIRAVEDIRTRFHNALEASQRGRDQNLQLYPTVFSSLWRIKSAGTKIIGYTEIPNRFRLNSSGFSAVAESLLAANVTA
jgi:hypothetical protein